MDFGDLVCVITEDVRAPDYRIVPDYDDADVMLPWLVHGTGLVDALQNPRTIPARPQNHALRHVREAAR